MHSINLTNENIYTDLVTEQHLPKNTKTNKDYELPFYFDNCNYLFMGFITDGRVRISNTIVAGPNEYPKVDFINQVLELINKMDNI